MMVLIFNVGDIVVKGICDVIDVIVIIIIFFSECFFKKDFKWFFKYVLFGVFFKEEIIEEIFIGILGEV